MSETEVCVGAVRTPRTRAQLEQPLAALWLQPTSAVAVDLDLLDGLVALEMTSSRLIKLHQQQQSPPCRRDCVAVSDERTDLLLLDPAQRENACCLCEPIYT